jgi:hypothetical protein
MECPDGLEGKADYGPPEGPPEHVSTNDPNVRLLRDEQVEDAWPIEIPMATDAPAMQPISRARFIPVERDHMPSAAPSIVPTAIPVNTPNSVLLTRTSAELCSCTAKNQHKRLGRPSDEAPRAEQRIEYDLDLRDIMPQTEPCPI